jgi:hypothetical protein
MVVERAAIRPSGKSGLVASRCLTKFSVVDAVALGMDRRQTG